MRKGPIRGLPGPLTRDLTELQNDLDRCWRCLPDLIERVAEAELKALALDNMDAPTRVIKGVVKDDRFGYRHLQLGPEAYWSPGSIILEGFEPGDSLLISIRREATNAGQ